MKVSIVGMGAVGATIAGALHKYQNDLVFIVRRNTKKRMLYQKGIVLESDSLYSGLITPQLISDDPKMIGIVDVLFICCKSYALEEVCKEYKSIVGDKTFVIPMLNGVMGQEIITKLLLNRGIVCNAYIYCYSKVVEIGKVRNTGNLLKAGIGIVKDTDNSRIQELSYMMTEGGLLTVCEDHIMHTIWEKYLMMCGNSCVLLYFNCSMGEIQKSKEKMSFLLGIYQDIYRVAWRKGVYLDSKIIKKYIDIFEQSHPDTTTSLYRDVKNGCELNEFEWLIGSLYKMAQMMKIKIPYIEKVYKKLVIVKE